MKSCRCLCRHENPFCVLVQLQAERMNWSWRRPSVWRWWRRRVKSVSALAAMQLLQCISR